MTRVVRSRPPRAGDPYGIGPIGTVAAPLLSIVGLLLIGIVTFNLLNGDVPFGIGSSDGDGGSGVGPDRTAAPSNVVVVPEEATFEGAIVYAKSGNIWVQTNDDVKQVTSSGGDSMPSWSKDGQWIIYIRSTRERGLWPVKGHNGRYDIDVPDLMRVRADGSARAGTAGDRIREGRAARVVGLDATAGPVARRQDHRAHHRRPEPGRGRGRAEVLQHGDQEVAGSRRPGKRRARASGSRVAPGWTASAVRAERPRRCPRGPQDHALRHQDQEGRDAQCGGLHAAFVFPGRSLCGRHPDDACWAPTS